MAKYGSGSIVIMFDNSGGTPVNMTAYVLTFNGMDIEGVTEDSTPFGVTWREFLAAGMRGITEITLGGMYDDTATTGPDVIFNAPASAPSTATRTLTVTWGGTKTTSAETFIRSYRRRPAVGTITKYEVALQPTGTVTEV